MKTFYLALAAIVMLSTATMAKDWPCPTYNTNFNDNLDTHCDRIGGSGGPGGPASCITPEADKCACNQHGK